MRNATAAGTAVRRDDLPLPTPPKGDLDREKIDRLLDEVERLEDSEVARELVRHLGARLTAAIGRVGATRLVRAWIDGTPPSAAPSLRAALKATRAIVEADGPAVARRWFVGTNRSFDHRSPLEAIRDDTPEARTQLVRAALAFIA